ncbi:MAG: ethanolamine ammonia-lyase subunit EutC [Pseudomonadota bacterium]
MKELSETRQAKLLSATQARLEHGRRNQALSTSKVQSFSLDHARAQAAVHSTLDTEQTATLLQAHRLPSTVVSSSATSRDEYIKRPDLGRVLPQTAVENLAKCAGDIDVAVVLGDGLSATASNLNGPTFLISLVEALEGCGLSVSPVVLAHQCRVALGDGIAQALNAEIVVVALGERPGLSAADSLGCYVTYRPTFDTQDSARNCISNIRENGLSVAEAVAQAVALIKAMRKYGKSGVTLSVDTDTGRRSPVEG